MSSEQFTKLVKALLESEEGVREEIFNLLMGIAVESGNEEAQALLVRADATDGWFYL